MDLELVDSELSSYVSVPSFGDSFFIVIDHIEQIFSIGLFPSPHSGILFLYDSIQKDVRKRVSGFRPLIRGFFFYVGTLGKDMMLRS